MAGKATCPELVDVLNENECLENIPGMGNNVYIGLKSDLAAPLTLTGSTYSTPTFKSGKGLYKVEASDDSRFRVLRLVTEVASISPLTLLSTL